MADIKQGQSEPGHTVLRQGLLKQFKSKILCMREQEG